MALDAQSPLELVHECFVKLGLRYVCMLRDGKFAGMVRRWPFSLSLSLSLFFFVVELTKW